ncbi:hypothetical protein FB451DRAFT_1176732 [Mycena latifolia]|nr:hypothetical protein FB451DRAFT_1176732 [Mycena latifolia]
MNDGCVSCIYTPFAVEAVMVAVLQGPAGYGSDGDVLTATLSNADSPANSCGGPTLCWKFLHTGEFGLIAILSAFGTGNTQLIADLPRSLPRGALRAGEKYQRDCLEGGSKEAMMAEDIWEATPGHPMLQIAPSTTSFLPGNHK